MNEKKHVFAFRFQMFTFFPAVPWEPFIKSESHGRWKGGTLALLDFEIFSKKGCFPDFEWEKTNYTTFGLPGKIFENLPSAPPPGKNLSDAPGQSNMSQCWLRSLLLRLIARI